MGYPVPIPDDAVPEGVKRSSIMPPPGKEDSIGACDALIDFFPGTDMPRFTTVWELTDEELEVIKKHKKVMVSMNVKQLVAHSVWVHDEDYYERFGDGEAGV